MHEVLTQLGFETKNGRDYRNSSKELAVVVLPEGFSLYAWGILRSGSTGIWQRPSQGPALWTASEAGWRSMFKNPEFRLF